MWNSFVLIACCFASLTPEDDVAPDDGGEVIEYADADADADAGVPEADDQWEEDLLLELEQELLGDGEASGDDAAGAASTPRPYDGIFLQGPDDQPDDGNRTPQPGPLDGAPPLAEPPLPPPAGPPPPPPPPPANIVEPAAAGVPRPLAGREHLEEGEGYLWGPFRLTPKPGGAWQARCPFHRLNRKTGCKKSLGVAGMSSAEIQLRLKHWCCQVALFDRQRHHRSFDVAVGFCPPQAVVEALRRPEIDIPAVPVPTDEELDRAEAAARGAVIEPGRGRGRGGGRGRGRGRVGRGVAGAGAAVPAVPAAGAGADAEASSASEAVGPNSSDVSGAASESACTEVSSDRDAASASPGPDEVGPNSSSTSSSSSGSEGCSDGR